MPHRAMARWVVGAERQFEGWVGRLNPAVAAWLAKHRVWVYRPVHLIGSSILALWGAQLWFLLPDEAFRSPNYRALRLLDLDTEGLLLLLIAVLMFLPPEWWVGTRVGRRLPLLPSLTMAAGASVMMTIATTISVSSLLSGSGALIGGYTVVALLMAVEAGNDASRAAKESVRLAAGGRHGGTG